MYGHQKSLLNNSTCVCVCVCVCVHMRVCMCVLVSVGSICKCTGYGEKLHVTRPLLSRSIYPQCTQVNPMYGHQKSLLKNSTCVCVDMRVCVWTCVCACVCVLNHKVSVGSICKRIGYGIQNSL